jgi:hypothetical protein
MVLAPFVNYNMDAIFPFCAEAAHKQMHFTPVILNMTGYNLSNLSVSQRLSMKSSNLTAILWRTQKERHVFLIPSIYMLLGLSSTIMMTKYCETNTFCTVFMRKFPERNIQFIV